MYKCYRPFNPVASHFLQHKWEFRRFSAHLDKVQFAHPVVDTRRLLTSRGSQCKMKTLQARRLSAAKRDNRAWGSMMEDNRLLASRMKNNRLLATRMKENRRLASRMANVKSAVNHRNEYSCKSLNESKRKQDLMAISEENQAMYQRLLCRKSVYSRESLLGDWMKTERLLQHLSQFSKEQGAKPKLERKKKMVTFAEEDQSRSTSSTERSKEIPDAQLKAGKTKQDLVGIRGKNQAMYQQLVPRKSVFSRENWLGDWKKTEHLLQHMSRYPKKQATKPKLERKEKMVPFDKSTTERSKEIPRDKLKAGKTKQDLVGIRGKNQAMYQRRVPRKSVFSRENWLGDWMKTERVLQHMSRNPKKQATKPKLERKKKLVAFDKQDQSTSKSTTERSKDIPDAQ
ncbi:uncharacterized protein si:ch211-284k5.2 isoform X2 [Gambusia affinis]|uniref:uncharacterized protein si:ch211-284k5.2 isoform X2 n=1 Tax=Gambusia affinis TaxID=33528 RepID=UPI001CDBDD0A|nr:uncharacterized protein si:ch211-284k5.2 isoform X2 [Gambusia affinis]